MRHPGELVGDRVGSQKSWVEVLHPGSSNRLDSPLRLLLPPSTGNFGGLVVGFCDPVVQIFYFTIACPMLCPQVDLTTESSRPPQFGADSSTASSCRILLILLVVIFSYYLEDSGCKVRLLVSATFHLA